MKQLTSKLYVLALAVMLFSCSSENFEELSPGDKVIVEEEETDEPSTYDYSEIETQTLDLVNNHREDIGLNKLIASEAVSIVAKNHTDYMIEAGELSHDNFEERSENLRKKENAKSVVENVAYGYPTAESAIEGWLNSSGHREIIEDKNLTHFGVGVGSDSKGRNFYTQIFIAK